MQIIKSTPARVALVVGYMGLLVACATLDPQTVETPPQGADGNTLVQADPYFLKPAAEWRSTMSWMSIPLLGTRIDTKLLTETAYDQWRKARLSTVSDVQAVAIRFDTKIVDGKPDRQSGMLFLPAARTDRNVEVNWIIWLKGTELLRENVPSRFAGVETSFAATFASLGYAIWMPDYAGMGDSPGIHPFCVPQSLANSAVDGLAAARHYLKEINRFYHESGRLDVVGYSEGGLAAMATMRDIAKQPHKIAGLKLATVYSMAAPLNLVTSTGGSPLNDIIIPKPEYSVYLVMGWARAYPNQVKMETILQPYIISHIVPLFDGLHDEDSLHRAIANLCGKRVGRVTLSDLFLPDYLDKLRNNREDIPFFQAQLAERLDRQAPPKGTILVLAASTHDEIVSPANSLAAFDWLQANRPDSTVQMVQLGSGDHISAGGEALLYAIQRIDQEANNHGLKFIQGVGAPGPDQ